MTSFLAGGICILVLMALTLFVVFFVRRSFDARDVEFLLTRPISRSGFVISQSIGFSILAIINGLILFAIVAAVGHKTADFQSISLWSLGITFEYIIVAQVAFFFSMVLSSPVTAGLSTLGFYLLGRMMGSLLAIAHQAYEHKIMTVLSYVMDGVSMIFPRLDLMAETSWLIYGGVQVSDWIFVVAQGLAFAAFVIMATIFDLKRREF